MKISIGTNNKGKVEAVRRACADYSILKNAELVSIDIPSDVSIQPVGLEEITTGAKNRAKAAWEKTRADLGVGLESGIFKVPHTKSEYMDTTACAIYDGKKFHLGLSSCFEYPKKMIDSILKDKKEVSDIALEMGFAKERSFREGEGMIGVLTKSRVTRIDYTYQAVQMALIHLENPEHY